MPNWACGSASITGIKPNVIKFVSRFIHDEDVGTDDRNELYFARSFTNDKRQSVLEDVEGAFHGIPEGIEGRFDLSVDFAWSAHSCLIDGYPQNNPDHCITLAAACVEDQVSVEIYTEEGGIGFEEYIFCDKQGQLTDTSTDLLPYKCRSCGNLMSLASFYDPDEYACWECGDVGLDPYEEERENK